jgi:uncharacterized protein (TIGR03437 family)
MWFRGAAWLLFVPCALAANVPTFTYSLSEVQISAIAVDAGGNTYITGTTLSGALAATPGAFQSQDNSSSGACSGSSGGSIPLPCGGSFITKLDPTGAVVFATYFGGNGLTTVNGIAVDQQGDVYVAGTTSPPVDVPGGSTNTFPVTPGAAFTNPAAGRGFVAKLNPSGSGLVYSTFIPAASIAALALDPEGNAYITGIGSPSSFPTTAGAFQVVPKGTTNFSPGIVAKLNASGSALVYATYLSGSGGPPDEGDNPNSIAVDAMGDAFIAGWTYSIDFPVTAGAFLTSSPGVRSIFLTKVNPQGSGLVYSTYLGETNGYQVTVKLDAQSTAFVAGATTAANFPTTPGEMATRTSGISGFLSRFSADGSSLIYSTYVPTVTFPAGALDVDSAGNAVIAGAPTYVDLPTGVGAFQPEDAAGTSAVYVERFTPDGQPSAATYLGSSLNDDVQLIALGANGSVTVAGFTRSADFPGVVGPVAGSGVDFVTSFFISLTVLNAASYIATEIAPGEIVSLLGYGIGPETGVIATGSTLPTELGGVQVSFGGFPAPLLYSQSHVINAQVPWELAGQTSTTVVVSYPGVSSTPTPVVVAPALPGILYVNNSDGTQNSPSNPAKPGDFITIYGTGGGPTSPAGIDGAFWSLTTPYPLLTLPVIVTIGSENAKVLYSGASPLSSSGIFQINALLPSNLPASSASSLVVNIGGVSSVAVPIAIQ